MEVIAGIIALMIATAVGIGYPEVISSVGTKTSAKLNQIAKKIYNMIADNQELMDKITDAYNRKDGEMATQLLQGMGFGNRNQAIKDAINAAKTEFQGQKAELVKKNADLTNKYNEANTASYNTNTIAGIHRGDEVIESLEQAVNGGSDNNA